MTTLAIEKVNGEMVLVSKGKRCEVYPMVAAPDPLPPPGWLDHPNCRCIPFWEVPPRGGMVVFDSPWNDIAMQMLIAALKAAPPAGGA